VTRRASGHRPVQGGDDAAVGVENGQREQSALHGRPGFVGHPADGREVPETVVADIEVGEGPALVGQGVIGGPALLGQESGGLDAEQAGRREGY
jgi:hypothetical protein